MFYFLVTGAMAVGAFYFNKIAVIKTAIACIVAFTAVQLLNSFIANIIFGELVGTGPFMNGVNIRSDGNWRIILPHQPQFFFKTLFLFILPIAFWLIALIRLREKEF